MVETYVGEGCALTRFWRERLLGEREVIIASPYLTSPLAEEILDMCDRQTVSVLTRCDLLDFLRGASSVAVLRRLIEVNVAVFVTPKLHAKVICTTGWASIGSKNLTLRSESNLEASVVVESPRDVARVRRVLEEWRSSGEQVMLADLEDIETQCDLLRADWAGLRARLRQTRDALGELRSNRQIQRRIEEERERQAREVERDAAEAARRLQDRVREAEERIEQSRYVSELRGIEVRDVPRGDGRRVRCIRRRGQDNLLVWLDGSAKLADKHHYVVFTQGRVAWLKINKTECSLLGRGFTRPFPDHHALAGYKLEVSGVEPDVNANVRGRLFDERGGEVRCWEGWFDDSGFIPTRDSENDKADFDLVEKIGMDVHCWFEREICRPFRYDKNNHGSRIHQVFEAAPGMAQLRLFNRPHRQMLVIYGLRSE